MLRKIEYLEVLEMCITSKCNLQCKHCYQVVEKNKFELGFSQIIDVIKYANNHGCRKYVLSGGEYFCHPNAYSILDYIINETNAEITCVTNLTIADVKKLSCYPSDRLSFKVSIDGDKDEHNMRRGDGTYEKAEQNIINLHNMDFRVDITMTLIEANIHCIPTVLSNPNFKNVTLLPVATTGAACEYFHKEKDSDLYEQVICHIYKTCRDYVDGSHRCYIFPKCFSIKYDGSIYPCSLSRDYELCKIGNINNGTIEHEISRFINSSESDIFFEYDNNGQIEKCNKCPNNNECTRGCRIRAYKWNGKLISADPFACKIFNNEYKDIPFGQVYWGTK